MNELDKFGKFFIQNLRDKSLDYLEGLFERKWKAPDLQNLQDRVAAFSPEFKQTVRELVESILTDGMHDLLFAIQENHDCNEGIEILVDGKPVAELSDGLHGEIFGEDGWMVRFSKHPAEKEIEGSKEAADFINELIKKKDEDQGYRDRTPHC
jgi:hypothetical protein